MEKYTYHDVDFRGRVERVEYTTTDQAGKSVGKYANVYLPYGYDTDEKKYKVLYVMHGGGGNADAFLDCAPVKNMLDYMFAEKKAEPMIVVFPSYYKTLNRALRQPGSMEERNETLFFQTELVEDLIPAVEGKYHSYAENVTKEGITTSRTHRGFSGFSMGGCTTWFALMYSLDYVSTFVPLSGDCWELDIKGGFTKPEETAQAIREKILNAGYSASDFKIYAATGTEDIACPALSAQVDAMRKQTDLFMEGKDYAEGNFHYLLVEGEYHCYEAVYQYLYEYLPYLF